MGPKKIHSAKPFDHKRDLSPQDYAKLLWKYACTVEVSHDFEEDMGSFGQTVDLVTAMELSKDLDHVIGLVLLKLL